MSVLRSSAHINQKRKMASGYSTTLKYKYWWRMNEHKFGKHAFSDTSNIKQRIKGIFCDIKNEHWFYLGEMGAELRVMNFMYIFYVLILNYFHVYNLFV